MGFSVRLRDCCAIYRSAKKTQRKLKRKRKREKKIQTVEQYKSVREGGESRENGRQFEEANIHSC